MGEKKIINIKIPEHIQCAEMIKLREGLTKLGIEWWDASDPDYYDLSIQRTHFAIAGNRWSVVHGYGTYGGYSLWRDKDDYLLELMTTSVNDGNPVGYLTADDVLNILELKGLSKGEDGF